ncbi:MAG: hypothetical protein HYT08_03380 [Candidatus Levybacteria bacterium]|nr:hypothetical protein [Candidatus Levybacteria bacterium]
MPDIFIANKEESNTRHPVARKRNFHIRNFLEARIKSSGKIKFANQKENEEIVLFLRAHIVRNLPWVAISIILILLPLLFYNFGLTENYLSFLSGQYITFILLFYYLVILGYILVNIMGWFYNILIITNLGVVDIDYSSILYHDVAFTKLTLVEDVNYTKTGFLRSLFNFGDLFIQTAGGKENLEAIGIPDPANAAHIVADSIGKGGGSG